MYFYLKGTIHIIIVPLIFIAVNFLSLKLKLFKSMEREQKDGKNDFGTVYFAICMTVMSVISYFCNKALIPYGIAVFCLSFGDGAAAMAGSLIKKHNPVIVKGKTLAGAVACFIFAALGIILICCVLDIEISFWRIALLAFISSVLEVISGKYDNFAVPLGVMLTATLIM